MAKRWYEYIGPDSQTITDLQTTNNYIDVSVYPPFVSEFCTGGIYVCAILAEEIPPCPCSPVPLNSPLSPLSNRIKMYLTLAKSTGLSQPNATGKKRYVYMKPTNDTP